MAQNLAVRLAVENGKQVETELKNIGEVGQQSLTKIGEGASSANREIAGIEVGAGKAANAFEFLKGVAQGFVAVIATAGTAYTILEMARNTLAITENWQQLGDRIRVATGDINVAAEAQKRLFDIAQETRRPMEDMAELFAKLTPGFQKQNLTLEQQLAIVKEVGQALTLTHADATQTSSALLQFSQMLGGAKVQAQELNPLMDSAPRLIQAIAAGLGTTTAGLKQMSEAGLEIPKVIEALLSQIQKLNEESAGLKRTSGEAFTQLSNDLSRVVADGGNAADIIGLVVGAIDKLDAAIKSPTFSAGIAAIIASVADFATQVVNGVSSAVKTVYELKAALTSVENTFNSLARTAGTALPQVDSFLGKVAGAALKMGEAIASQDKRTLDAIRNALRYVGILDEATRKSAGFAGAGNFRAAQEAGTSPGLVIGLHTPNIEPESPFKPTARPDNAEADRAALQAHERAAKAAEDAAKRAAAAATKALEDARKSYADNEKVINDILKDLTKSTNERTQFINSEVAKLNLDATDEEIAKVRELAAARYDQLEAQKRANAEEARQKALYEEGIQLTAEHASATDKFAAAIKHLDDVRKAGGLSMKAYQEEARSASDEAAKAANEGFESQKKSAEENYDAIRTVAQTAFQGISTGLATMIVEGKADWDTFLKGMATSIIQSGIQQALMGALGGLAGAFGGGGAPVGGGFGAGASGGGNFFGLYHAGGTLSEPSNVRFLSPSVFDNASRYHTGRLAPNEIAGIFKNDETILTPGQMRQLSPANQNQNITIQNKVEIINNSSEKVTTEDKQGGGLKVTIGNLIATSIAERGSASNRAVTEIVKRHANGR